MQFYFESRRQAADRIVGVLTSSKKLGLMQEMLKVFRFKISKIQRAWRNVLAHRSARQVLLSRAWDHNVSWLRGELERLNGLIAALKDSQDKKLSVQERVEQRDALDHELAALPKLRGAPNDLHKPIVSATLKVTAIELWAAKEWERHTASVREYWKLQTAYEIKVEKMAVRFRDSSPSVRRSLILHLLPPRLFRC